MKGLKKLTLASAIVAAPFASQAMEALDDATMGDVTGQAGVTIVTEADLTIGDITYTDDGTSLVVSGVSVSQADNSAVPITQTIDVTAGGLEIGISAINDLKATVDAVNLGNGGTIGALRIDADIASQTQTIASGGVTGGDGGVTITQTLNITDVDVLYVDGVFDKSAAGEIVGTLASYGADGLDDDAVGATPASDVAGGAAVFIDTLSTTALSISQSIDVVDYVATSTTGSVNAGDTVGALAITAGAMSGSLSIDGIKFLSSAQADAAAGDLTGDVSNVAAVANAASIGSIDINNFSMAGSTTYIYAH